MRAYWRQVGWILWKELRAEWRTRQTVTSMAIFAFLVIVVFSFAFDPTRDVTRRVLPGILWIAYLFAAVLGLNRSFMVERFNDSLLGLLSAPMDRSTIYFGKAAANLLFVLLVEALSLPVFLALYDVLPDLRLEELLLVLLLGTLGFVEVGTFLSALSANSRSSELLLPLLLFPVALPVVIASVQLTAALLAAPAAAGAVAPGWAELWSLPWLKVLLVYDGVFLLLPFLLFDYVLEV